MRASSGSLAIYAARAGTRRRGRCTAQAALPGGRAAAAAGPRASCAPGRSTPPRRRPGREPRRLRRRETGAGARRAGTPSAPLPLCEDDPPELPHGDAETLRHLLDAQLAAEQPDGGGDAAVELDRTDPRVDARLVIEPVRAARADDIRELDRLVPERGRIDAERGPDRLGSEPDAAQDGARVEDRPRHLVGQADDLASPAAEQQQIGAAVGQDPPHAAGTDAVLPAARDDVPPGGRRRPFAVAVRFLQDLVPSACQPVCMKARVDFITLRVEDLDAATSFYTDGLGWKRILTVPDEVTFIQLGPGQAARPLHRERLR